MCVLPGCQLGISGKRADECILLKYASENRWKSNFVDITIEVGTQKIQVHKMVLACYSSYFEKLFLDPKFIGSSGSITFTDLDEEALVQLIEYFYTRNIVVNNENVINLLSTAKKLEVNTAIQFCLEYLETAISLKNWYFILTKANLLEIDLAKNIAHMFMSDEFYDVSKSDIFMQLAKADLSACISGIDRCKISEILIYNAIIRWTNYSLKDRKMDFPDLFFRLNLDQFSGDFMLKVVSIEKLITENDDCRRYLEEKMEALRKKNKIPRNESKILSLGGNRTGSKVSVVFNILKDSKTYPDLPMKIYGHCTLVLNKTIFCIGGQSDDNQDESSSSEGKGNITNKVWKLDLKQNSLEWREVAGINEEKSLIGGAVYDDTLVVAGGCNERQPFATAEVYLKSTNKWKFISSMSQTRICHAVVSCYGWLYAIGGADKEGNVLSTVERLPDLCGMWEPSKPMQTPRMWFAAASVRGCIFVMGGTSDFAGNNVLKSVEKFDPKKKTWKYVKDLNFKRKSLSACVFMNRIYVVGGVRDSNHYVSEIECYDSTRDEWSIVRNFNESLTLHSLAAI